MGGGATGVGATTTGRGALGIATDGALAGTLRLILIGAAGVGAETTGFADGGGAISGAGARPSRCGGATLPSSCRASSSKRAERSTLQLGHAKRGGLRNISGVASRAYFAPQSHWTFIRLQGLGFSRVILVAIGKGISNFGMEELIAPSQYKNEPPYLW